ncbi:putative hydrogenase nickel incorporation protein HypA [Burkholderiales bacterium]|nr:putative hydrogenase nickel incorporation protein HypA [Burkholderiales bacterium]
MHEMSLALGILGLLEEAARREKAARVKAVWLELGALSAAEPQAIAFCFEAVTRGTVAEGARLTIEAIPGRAWCLPCMESTVIARRGDPCPHCGGYQLHLADGTQMRVREMEIESQRAPDVH